MTTLPAIHDGARTSYVGEPAPPTTRPKPDYAKEARRRAQAADDERELQILKKQLLITNRALGDADRRKQDWEERLANNRKKEDPIKKQEEDYVKQREEAAAAEDDIRRKKIISGDESEIDKYSEDEQLELRLEQRLNRISDLATGKRKPPPSTYYTALEYKVLEEQRVANERQLRRKEEADRQAANMSPTQRRVNQIKRDAEEVKVMTKVLAQQGQRQSARKRQLEAHMGTTPKGAPDAAYEANLRRQARKETGQRPSSTIFGGNPPLIPTKPSASPPSNKRPTGNAPRAAPTRLNNGAADQGVAAGAHMKSYEPRPPPPPKRVQQTEYAEESPTYSAGGEDAAVAAPVAPEATHAASYAAPPSQPSTYSAAAGGAVHYISQQQPQPTAEYQQQQEAEQSTYSNVNQDSKNGFTPSDGASNIASAPSDGNTTNESDPVPEQQDKPKSKDNHPLYLGGADPHPRPAGANPYLEMVYAAADTQATAAYEELPGLHLFSNVSAKAGYNAFLLMCCAEVKPFLHLQLLGYKPEVMCARYVGQLRGIAGNLPIFYTPAQPISDNSSSNSSSATNSKPGTAPTGDVPISPPPTLPATPPLPRLDSVTTNSIGTPPTIVESPQKRDSDPRPLMRRELSFTKATRHEFTPNKPVDSVKENEVESTIEIKGRRSLHDAEKRKAEQSQAGEPTHVGGFNLAEIEASLSKQTSNEETQSTIQYSSYTAKKQKQKQVQEEQVIVHVDQVVYKPKREQEDLGGLNFLLHHYENQMPGKRLEGLNAIQHSIAQFQMEYNNP
eukprot:TRINITY_DN2679_c0_g1_i1.p1 TRINITY_DN2679_c0_g1~~TRINITY_DN2679_c0_g1_i1.p1  ORF type:complete len:788 (+),score=131.17 TRINITY_DN2679_c0_g1_i1:54-2417(+)